jgi:hypothetical protein
MRVFLSHANEAKPRVQAIAAHFPPHVDIWLDVHELAAGTRLPEHIGRAIEFECDYVIVFVDEHALASEWVKRETALALQRERDLKRPFLLPVLLAPLAGRLAELGDLGERIHLDASDATAESVEGTRRAGERLAAELFALASRLVETLRSTGRRQLLTAFGDELLAFKQAAFLWIAELANPLVVLSTNQQAFDNVRRAVQAYNEVADRFIPRLHLHRDRIGAAWSGYRGLTQDLRELVESIENRVYRGALLDLNEVHAMIHQLDAEGTHADAASVQRLQARRDELLEAARGALKTLTQRSTQLLAELEREI